MRHAFTFTLAALVLASLPAAAATLTVTVLNKCGAACPFTLSAKDFNKKPVTPTTVTINDGAAETISVVGYTLDSLSVTYGSNNTVTVSEDKLRTQKDWVFNKRHSLEKRQ